MHVQAVLLPVVDLNVLQFFHEFHGLRVIDAVTRNILRPAFLVTRVNALLNDGDFVPALLQTILCVVDDHVYEERGLSVDDLYLHLRTTLWDGDKLEALRAEGRETRPCGTELRTRDRDRAQKHGDGLELGAAVRNDELVLHCAGPESEHPDWSGNELHAV